MADSVAQVEDENGRDEDDEEAVAVTGRVEDDEGIKEAACIGLLP